MEPKLAKGTVLLVSRNTVSVITAGVLLVNAEVV